MIMKKYTERRMREVTTDTFRIELNMPKDYPPIKARRTEDGGVRDRFFAAKAELPDEITVVRPYNVDAFANPVTIYVAEDGDDAAAGTKDAPLATLGAALDKATDKGGAKIVLRGGSYEIDSPVKIGAEHSGTEKSPLIVTAEKGEVPMISAAKKIPASAFRKLTDEKMLSRLKPEVRDNVLVADITAAGITEFGTVAGSNLFLNSAPLTLARYPNDGEPLIPVGERIIHTGYEDRKPSGDWEIGIEDEKCLEWEWNDEIHIHGALCYEWNRYTTKIQAFDRENKTMRGFGAFENAPVMKGERNNYYFRNVFEELDLPGEWYLDRNDGNRVKRRRNRNADDRQKVLQHRRVLQHARHRTDDRRERFAHATPQTAPETHSCFPFFLLFDLTTAIVAVVIPLLRRPFGGRQTGDIAARSITDFVCGAVLQNYPTRSPADKIARKRNPGIIARPKTNMR